jgi:hypothetical protein
MQADCNKRQEQHKKLIPGCMMYWCMECRKCVGFNIMADAESPRTVMETLYTRWQSPPKYFCLDNGCNAYNYFLNREPEHFRDMEVFVDEMHWKGHKNCSPAFNTGNGDQILVTQSRPGHTFFVTL